MADPSPADACERDPRARPGPRRAWLALLAAALLLAAAPPSRAEKVSGPLKIYVLNVGQGDAILVVCPHQKTPHYLLIDSGARGYTGSQEAFRQQLQKLIPGVQPRLEVLVASHPHEDHIGGVAWVLENFQVRKFVDNGQSYTSSFSKIGTLARQQAKSRRLTYIRAGQFPSDRVADFCPASNVNSELLIPKGFGKSKNKNNNSVILRLTHNKLVFLFTGDAEKEEEKQLLDDTRTALRVRHAVFYKVGHHGAETSSTAPLLQQMTPQWAAISAGAKNKAKNKGYRHPRALTLTALLGVITKDPGQELRTVDAGESAKGKWTQVQIHKRIYVTAKDDTLLFVSDGTQVTRGDAKLISPVGHN